MILQRVARSAKSVGVVPTPAVSLSSKIKLVEVGPRPYRTLRKPATKQCWQAAADCFAPSAVVRPPNPNDSCAALCTARSYEQLVSLNAPEAVIALVDRQEAVPLNWT